MISHYLSGETFQQHIERLSQERAEEELIRCPECNLIQPNDDWPKGAVTYWGEGTPVEFWCQFCYSTFMVQEHVRRTFTVTAQEEEPTP